MLDLDTQLRDYFDHVVQRVEADDVFVVGVGAEPVRPLRVRPSRRHVPGWVYGLAAAAVVLVFVGGAALLISPTDNVAPQGTTPPTPTIAVSTTTPPPEAATTIPPPSSTTPSTAAPNTTIVPAPQVPVWPSPVPAAEDLLSGWTQLASGRVVPIAYGGPGLISFGEHLADPGDDLPVVSLPNSVWLSADGISWEEVPQEPGVFDGSVPGTVTPGGPGLVGVGSYFPPLEPGEEPDQGPVGAVWTSPDGRTWTRIPRDPVFECSSGDSNIGLHGVAGGGSGLVAVGNSYCGEPGPGSRGPASVWTSVDGVTWSLVTDDELLTGNDVYGVVAGGPGFVAVGPADLWTSVDGGSWTRVPADVAFGEGAGITGIATYDEGLIAFGTTRNPETEYGIPGFASIWTSIDGLHWTKVLGDPGLMGSIAVITDVGPALLAGGYNGFGLPDQRARMWISADGSNWTRIPDNELPAGCRIIEEILVTPHGVVATGSSCPPIEWTPPG